jgi:hypothetical protein
MVELRKCHFFVVRGARQCSESEIQNRRIARSILSSGVKFLPDLCLIVVLVGATASGKVSVFEFFKEVAS